MNDLRHKAKAVRLLILDVDGVLTDGRVYVGCCGDEMKAFHIRDGYALKLLQASGIGIALLSGRRSEPTRARAAELGIDEVHEGALVKLPVYEDLLRRRGLTDAEVAFMGDDLMDVPLLRRAGLSGTVADATREAKDASDYVAQAQGGAGAVREFVELILKAQGLWDAVLRGLETGAPEALP
ncbi:MAG: HAD hydrolase family protein [bacterium]